MGGQGVIPPSPKILVDPLKSLIHKIDALFVLHQFANIHSPQICVTKEINQVGKANNSKIILTRLSVF